MEPLTIVFEDAESLKAHLDDFRGSTESREYLLTEARFQRAIAAANLAVGKGDLITWRAANALVDEIDRANDHLTAESSTKPVEAVHNVKPTPTPELRHLTPWQRFLTAFA